MLYEAFLNVYTKFKMHFYKEAFKKDSESGNALTIVETFCMEAIHALGKPTVSQFARFMSFSSANAADKVNNLIHKGYLNKVRAEGDKRKYYLEVTPLYYEYYNKSYQYLKEIIKRVQYQFTDEELHTLTKLLTVLNQELLSDLEYECGAEGAQKQEAYGK
ncbi:MAG: MarR family transcriptional regulator [Firmicutes bacterium]|nr:MarR family transcriptional regulator [Bacillota bacterium]